MIPAGIELASSSSLLLGRVFAARSHHSPTLWYGTEPFYIREMPSPLKRPCRQAVPPQRHPPAVSAGQPGRGGDLTRSGRQRGHHHMGRYRHHLLGAASSPTGITEREFARERRRWRAAIWPQAGSRQPIRGRTGCHSARPAANAKSTAVWKERAEGRRFASCERTASDRKGATR